MNIVITNVYCYMNKGDAGIVISMVEQINKYFNNPTITIISLKPEIDQGKYGKNVRIVSPYVKHKFSNNKYKRVIYNIYTFTKEKIGLILSSDNEMIEAIENADLVISCGGGYMQSFNYKNYLSNFILHYSQLYAAWKLNKKYIIFAQTIGPFNKAIIPKVRKIIENATLVTTREKFSYDYVNTNFSNANNILTADTAFLLENKETNKLKINKNDINVGLTIRDWHFPNSLNPEELKSNYFSSIKLFIEQITEKNDVKVFIMPQCIGPDSDNDLIISTKLYNSLKKQKNVTLVSDDLEPGELKMLYSKMNYFVGMRMHSNIFALANKVPCLAISYDKKTNGIMELVGLNRYIIDVSSINSDLLIKKFTDLQQDTKVKSILDVTIPNIVDEAKYNYNLLKELVDKDER